MKTLRHIGSLAFVGGLGVLAYVVLWLVIPRRVERSVAQE